MDDVNNPAPNAEITDVDPKQLAQELEAIKQEKEAMEEQLKKAQEKEFNWEKLRKKAEKADEYTEKEKVLTEGLQDLHKKQQELETRERNSNLDLVLKNFAGNDENLKKELMMNYDRLNDPANTYSEVYDKMKNAYKMTGRTLGDNRSYNNIASGVYNQGNYVPQEKKSLYETDEAKRIRKTMFRGSHTIEEEDIKKYGVPQKEWQPRIVKN